MASVGRGGRVEAEWRQGRKEGVRQAEWRQGRKEGVRQERQVLGEAEWRQGRAGHCLTDSLLSSPLCLFHLHELR